MKKLLIAVVALSSSLLYSQENTIIDDFIKTYTDSLEQIIIDEFENIVIEPTTANIENDVKNRLAQNPVDLVEAQTIVSNLDSELLDTTIEALLESSAQKVAVDLQAIIQAAILESIEKSIEGENPAEVTEIVEEEIIPEEVVKEQIIAEDEVTEADIILAEKIEPQRIETSISEPKIEEPVIKEPVIEEPAIPTTSDAPEKINYISGGTTKTAQPTISQTIQLKVDDYTDIVLNGEGWIFLGELEESAKPVVSFYNRYMDGVDSYFGFDATNPGTTILHFYKQDIIGRTYLDEYVKVIVKQKQTTKNSQANKVEEAFGISAEPVVSLAGGGSAVVINDTSMADYGFVPETILDEAEIAYNEENYEESIALLDEYTSVGKNSVDRALYLYAKNYESSKTDRNVKLAHSYYNKLVKTFPDSQYFDDSEKRILYLERFYIIIR